MTKKSLFIWIFLLIFGLSSMPEIGFANATKHTGKTEVKKKKKSPKKHKKSSRKKKSSSKKKKGTKKKSSKKRGSKNKRSGGKKKYSKKRKKGSRKRSRRTYSRSYYTPPTNNGSVEYRNYKRNSDADNQSKENIDQIAPSKEIKKEPKKEGE